MISFCPFIPTFQCQGQACVSVSGWAGVNWSLGVASVKELQIMFTGHDTQRPEIKVLGIKYRRNYSPLEDVSYKFLSRKEGRIDLWSP